MSENEGILSLVVKHFLLTFFSIVDITKYSLVLSVMESSKRKVALAHVSDIAVEGLVWGRLGGGLILGTLGGYIGASVETKGSFPIRHIHSISCLDSCLARSSGDELPQTPPEKMRRSLTGKKVTVTAENSQQLTGAVIAWRVDTMQLHAKGADTSITLRLRTIESISSGIRFRV